MSSVIVNASVVAPPNPILTPDISPEVEYILAETLYVLPTINVVILSTASWVPSSDVADVPVIVKISPDKECAPPPIVPLSSNSAQSGVEEVVISIFLLAEIASVSISKLPSAVSIKLFPSAPYSLLVSNVQAISSPLIVKASGASPVPASTAPSSRSPLST